MIIPFQGALNFFLGLWSTLPSPFISYFAVVFIFFLVSTLVRIFVD